jgi:acetyl-CoA synthase
MTHNNVLSPAYGQEYEGERIRQDRLYMECGGMSSRMVEWLTAASMKDIQDGRIDVIGPDLKDAPEKSSLPMAIIVEVAGKSMQEDYEPVLEKQIHRIINRIQGVMHTGQRDMACLRISQAAVEQGFSLHNLGMILYRKLLDDFGRILDKVQINIYTGEDKVTEMLARAREAYSLRDAHAEGMTDEDVDIFYSCIICQSFVPFHVCTISPERSSPCGSYSWIACKASCDIDPSGPNKPALKGNSIDIRLGQWHGINEFVEKASQGKTDHYNLYSIMNQPMATCEWVECISIVLPLCNGIMTVGKEYSGMTPSGMDFKTIIDNIKGELNTPGFMGHSRYNITQRKFISAEGGIKRIVWMPRRLKEEISGRFNTRAKEIDIPDLMERIADESTGTSEEAILPFLKARNHPALSMEPIIQL